MRSTLQAFGGLMFGLAIGVALLAVVCLSNDRRPQ